MKKRMYPTKLVVRVQCSRNDFHKISINKRGQLVFHNHTRDDFARLPLWYEMGGKPMGCYQFMERWRKALQTGKGYSYLPSSALPFFRECQEHQAVRKARNKEKVSIKSLSDLWIVEDPHPLALSKVLNGLLHRHCDLPDEEWVRVMPLNAEYYLLAILHPWPRDSGGPVVTTVPVAWQEKVARCGLAVHDKAVTLDAEPLWFGPKEGQAKAHRVVQLVPRYTGYNHMAVGLSSRLIVHPEKATVPTTAIALGGDCLVRSNQAVAIANIP